MLRKVALSLVGLGMVVSGSALAASDVSNSGTAQNQAVTAQSAPIAASQSASIIGGAIGNAIGGFSGGSALSANSSGTNYLNSRDTGRNAGAADKPFGVWLQGAYTSLDNSQTGASADGDIINVLGGFDYKLSDRLVLGVAATYETIDIDTNTLGGRGNLKNDGVGLAPYVGFKLTEQWSATLTAGYSWLNYDAKRANNTVSGSFDAERWFVNGALNGAYKSGTLRLMPQVGVLYLEEEQDGYRESTGALQAGNTIKLGRLYAGGRVGYAMGNVMPYVKLVGEYDFEHPDALAVGNGTFTNADDFGGQVGLGAEFFSTGPLSGVVETSYNSLGRSDLDVWSLMGRIRLQF